ncbi:MAG: fibronectin type III domain-containing protein [Fibrobacteria bacterium]
MSAMALLLSLWGGVQAAPDLPVATNPIDNASQLQPNVTFTWTGSVGSTYRLQVSTSETFADTVVDEQGFTDTFRNPAGLKHGTHYFWHVSARNATGVSEYSPTFDFTTIIAAPPITVLAEPANGATNTSIKPVLKWRKLTQASGYQVQIATNAAFTTPVLDLTTTGDTTLTPGTNFEVSKLHYWRVRARNVGGEGPWSAAWTFTTIPPLPAVPDLLVPADNAAALTLPITFKWHKAERAAAYTVVISTFSDFRTTLFDTAIARGDTALVYSGKLVYGATYYWRVRSENAGGNSAYAQADHFSTLEKPPAPLLALPAVDAVNLPLTPGLFWRKTARAVSYRLEVSLSAAFTTLLVNDSTGDTSKVLSPLQYQTAYYWRVRARNAAGFSVYSEVRKLTTLTLAVPPASDLVSPADGADAQAATLVLKWRTSLRTDTYRLQVSLSPTFATTVFDDATLKDTTKSVGPLKDNETYYWRVNAKNAAGAGVFSEIRSFTTKEGAAAEPVLVSPADNAGNLPTDVTFKWKTSANATTYLVQVSEKADFSTKVEEDEDVDTEFVAEDLDNGKTYYWRVRAQNGAGNSDYSDARKFTVVVHAPDACVLISPTDNATDQKLNLTLTWHKVPQASAYRIQMSLAPSFSTVSIDDSALTDTTKSFTELAANTQFYWRVRAKNAGGLGAWSEIRGFKTLAVTAISQLRSGKSEGFQLLSGRPGAGAEVVYAVPEARHVRFTVINPADGRSFDLVDRSVEAGSYRLAVGSLGRARGIYFLSMTAGTYRQTQKVFLP